MSYYKTIVLTPGKQLKNGNTETAGRIARILNTDLIFSTDNPEQTLQQILQVLIEIKLVKPVFIKNYHLFDFIPQNCTTGMFKP